MKPDRLDAVFFDLDDTLLDTAGLLVGPALADAAAAMVAAGLAAERDEVEAYLEDRARARLGLEYFGAAAERFGAHGRQRAAIVAAGRQAFFAREIPEIRALPGVRELLRRMSGRWRLFLVTAGDPATQRAKLRRLSLADVFAAVRCIDSLRGESKLGAFEELLEEFELDPRRCACVGDRIQGEILDGNRLGMWTIRVRRGEFAAMEPRQPDEHPDFTVDGVDALARLFGIEIAA